MIDRSQINILVGCEESQAVCIELRKLGFNAFSCDFKDCSGGHQEWHLKMNILKAIKLKNWHGLICFPDCTFITSSGLHWNNKTPGRKEKTEKGLQFVCDLLNCGIKRIALENPIGCISTRIFKDIDGIYKIHPEPVKGSFKPTQIIQPYNFGEDASKSTCLWLINLPALKNTKYIPPRIVGGKKRWSNQTDSGQNKLPPSEKRAELRSKTYKGIAEQMALQWSTFFINN